MSRLQHALSAAAIGCRVFPLQPTKKYEYGTGHQLDRTHATTDAQEIQKWWKQNTPYNIGALLPPGIVCIDVDSERLEAFKPYNVSGTLTHSTPSGGLHVFYRVPEGLKTRSKIDIGKCEIFGEGGRVVWAGSTTKEGKYVEQADDGITPAPQWVIDAIKQHEAPRAIKAVIEPAKFAEAKTPAQVSPRYGETALLAECARVRDAAKGNRSATLNRAAFKLGQLVPSGVLTQSAIEEHLSQATHGWNLPAKVRHVIKKGIADGMRSPRYPQAHEVKKTTRTAIAEMHNLTATAKWTGKIKTKAGNVRNTTTRAGIVAMLDRANAANSTEIHTSQRELAEDAHMGKETAWKALTAMQQLGLIEPMKRETGAAKACVYRLSLRGFLALQASAAGDISESLTSQLKESRTGSSSVGYVSDSDMSPRQLGIFGHFELGRSAESIMQRLARGPATLSQIVTDTGTMKRTAIRTLQRLMDAGMVEHDDRAPYSISADVNTKAIARAVKGNTIMRAANKARRHSEERALWKGKVEAREAEI